MSVFLEGAACGGGCVALASCAWKSLEKWSRKLIADCDTGEQRRANTPPHIQVSNSYPAEGAYEFQVSKKAAVKNERGFITLKDGTNIFWQMWVPYTFSRPKAGLLFFHGFGDHCDAGLAMRAKALCSLGGFAGITFDMPGHGRSDGLIAYIPSWDAFISSIMEVVVDHLIPKLKALQPTMKIFGLGDSMGGGVLYSLLIREKELFKGAVLACPMLFVHPDLAPPYPVVLVLKHVVRHLIPLWPIVPSKDLEGECWEDPEMLEMIRNWTPHRGLVYGRAKPRLETGYQIFFVGGDWMRANIPEYDTPTLIFHSPQDSVTDYRVSKELYDSMKGTDKMLIDPPNVKHADLFHGGPTKYDETAERMQIVLKW
eukprot:CAMPEP_0178388348 /NCGR_PEP_ID=MMETSP0689_2-20121128/9543_1 /TAXON_ID=160604 /ORGANISM="Amphidinium massartii, Strain CS-259" /LENGTH=369 /DNA_ID=CAMNT_0020008741 /DNA_START=26 /DNA_END=1132 /DNA_ORIENTATION=-